eukprot:4335307-Heterocapsa_arctica.AAC.1
MYCNVYNNAIGSKHICATNGASLGLHVLHDVVQALCIMFLELLRLHVVHPERHCAALQCT